MDYQTFLKSKDYTQQAAGIADPPALSPRLFEYQRDVTRWALRKGKAALFLDCGLGKTLCQLDWARAVQQHTGGRVLILAPLAVASQTVKIGEDMGIAVEYARNGEVAAEPITITNYEMLERFRPSDFAGIVLDESSILKSYTGATRTAIIDAFGQTPFRLACTATPAPNDHMELGNHAEFLGVMRRTEMLSQYFVHDGGETQKWRLKGHAVESFWRWVASWAVMMRRPSDLGYSDEGFELPPLNVETIIVDAGENDAAERGLLFPLPASTLDERRAARKASIGQRVARVAEIVNASPSEPFFVLCNLNAEGDALADAIPDAVQVAGADSLADKEDRLAGFAEGRYRALVSKSVIAGFGLNLQVCAEVVFAGLSDSYEAFYQTIRRCHRFGQKRRVTVRIVVGEAEQAILANIQRKQREADEMAEGMVKAMAEISKEEIHGTERELSKYETAKASGEGWEVYRGDCVETLRLLPDASVDFSVFSPPFASLYVYSSSDRDMGNVKDHAEFFQHFGFLIPELFRVTKPGRLLSFHCMNLPTSKVRDGVIGLTDFRGQLIKAFQDAGWIYHSEVCIFKDPVTAMQRTKAIGLLHKQLVKDSAMSRQGIPDYLVTMRKPGDNAEPIKGVLAEYVGTDETLPDTRGKWNRDEMRDSINIWQRYASPVWMDINPSDTLQRTSAREEKDERHIAPLQLQVVHRALQLWTNPGDLVLSPFAGIGSEGFEAIKMGRRFVGVELKDSYFRQAVANLQRAERERATIGLFADTETESVSDSDKSDAAAPLADESETVEA